MKRWIKLSGCGSILFRQWPRAILTSPADAMDGRLPTLSITLQEGDIVT